MRFARRSAGKTVRLRRSAATSSRPGPERPRRAPRSGSGRDRGRPARLCHADRRAGLEPGTDGPAGCRLAGDRGGNDRRSTVRLVHADQLQRSGRDLVGPARSRRLGRRRDDVPRPDGLERRRPLGQAARALADRAAGDLGRGDRRRVGALARGARLLRPRIPPPCDRCERRRALRQRDRPGRSHEPARGRRLRRRRDPETGHVPGGTGRAEAGLPARKAR